MLMKKVVPHESDDECEDYCNPLMEFLMQDKSKPPPLIPVIPSSLDEQLPPPVRGIQRPNEWIIINKIDDTFENAVSYLCFIVIMVNNLSYIKKQIPSFIISVILRSLLG